MPSAAGSSSSQQPRVRCGDEEATTALTQVAGVHDVCPLQSADPVCCLLWLCLLSAPVLTIIRHVADDVYRASKDITSAGSCTSLGTAAGDQVDRLGKLLKRLFTTAVKDSEKTQSVVVGRMAASSAGQSRGLFETFKSVTLRIASPRAFSKHHVVSFGSQNNMQPQWCGAVRGVADDGGSPTLVGGPTAGLIANGRWHQGGMSVW